MLANIPAGPHNVTIHRDIPYATTHPRLVLDIMRPHLTEASSPRAAIVYLHGGGYVMGEKDTSITRFLASRGWITVSINYRLSTIAPFPAALEDASTALQWLRDNGHEYGIDGTRLGVWGISAGGHLAASLVTMRSAPPQAASITAGYMDLLAAASPLESELVQRLLGWMLNTAAPVSSEKARTVSPQHHIPTSPLPPIHLLHGTADDVVPYSQSTEFVMALREAGHTAYLDSIPGAGHSFTNGAWFHVENYTLNFFEKHLPPLLA